MKKKLFVLVFFMICFNAKSQVNKYRAVSAGFSIMEKGYYPNFMKDNSIIILSIDEKKMTIYHNDETESNYHFLKVLGTETDKEKNIIGRILSIDDDGKKCEIILIELSKSNYEKNQKTYYRFQLVIKDNESDSYMMVNMNPI